VRMIFPSRRLTAVAVNYFKGWSDGVWRSDHA
jgi:hypothetical protein